MALAAPTLAGLVAAILHGYFQVSEIALRKGKASLGLMPSQGPSAIARASDLKIRNVDRSADQRSADQSRIHRRGLRRYARALTHNLSRAELAPDGEIYS